MDLQSVCFITALFLKETIMMGSFVASACKSAKKEIFMLGITRTGLRKDSEHIIVLESESHTKVILLVL